MDLLQLHADEGAVDIMRVLADPADGVDRSLADQLIDADMLERIVDADDLLAHMEIVTHPALLDATEAIRRVVEIQA